MILRSHAILQNLIHIDMAVGFFDYQGEDKQCKRSGTDQPADDDDSQRSLALTSYAVADSRRKQSQSGHQCRHQHRADA